MRTIKMNKGENIQARIRVKSKSPRNNNINL